MLRPIEEAVNISASASRWRPRIPFPTLRRPALMLVAATVCGVLKPAPIRAFEDLPVCCHFLKRVLCLSL